MSVTQAEPSLLPHQEEGVEWILRTTKGLVADEAGLGKTPQALVAIDRLITSGGLSDPPHTPPGPRLARVLWVTDAALLSQTKAEAERFTPLLSVLSGLDPELKTGSKAQLALRQRFPGGVELLILSYETVHSRRQWLSRFPFQMLVLDEASNVKGRGQHFEAVRDLATRTPRVLSMTATPIENDPTELWTLLRATDTPGLWSQREFDESFVIWRTAWVDARGRPHDVADSWHESALEEVRSYISQVVLRRTHQALGTIRPRKVETAAIEVPLTAAQRAAYEKANRSGGRDVVRKMEVASLFGGKNPPMVTALVGELSRRPHEPAIVFCETLEMLDVVEKRLNDRGIATCRIEGKVSEAGRKEAISLHRSGHAHVLLASRVLEYGLNLQHCRLLISLDTSWNPAREKQREGRLCRLGSPHQTYEHLVIRPATGLAQAKADRLDRKLRAAELVGLA